MPQRGAARQAAQTRKACVCRACRHWDTRRRQVKLAPRCGAHRTLRRCGSCARANGARSASTCVAASEFGCCSGRSTRHWPRWPRLPLAPAKRCPLQWAAEAQEGGVGGEQDCGSNETKASSVGQTKAPGSRPQNHACAFRTRGRRACSRNSARRESDLSWRRRRQSAYTVLLAPPSPSPSSASSSTP